MLCLYGPDQYITRALKLPIASGQQNILYMQGLDGPTIALYA